MAFQLFTIDAPAGVNLSIEPSQLNPKIWDEASNITFRHGKTFKCNGFEEGFGEAKTLPEIIVPLRDDSQEFYWWAYAGKQTSDTNPDGAYKIYKVTSRGVHDDVTPTGEGGVDVIKVANIWDPPKWSGDTLNGTPFLCLEKPYVWAGDKFEPMSKFPQFLSFRNMRTYKNFIIGLNFATDGRTAQEGLEGFSEWKQGVHQDAIWWSHDIASDSLQVEEDSKSLWCDADANRNSGWNFLGGGGGPIVDGKSMRDSFIIYRERSVWQMSFIGGLEVFSFKELFNDVGALSQNCIAEVDGQHFVIGHSDVYLHNGIQKQSICDAVVRKAIFERVDPKFVNNIFASVDYANKEFWVCIPELRTADVPDYIRGSCNVAFVYNWQEQTWSKRDIPDILCSTYTILDLPQSDISWLAPEEEASWTSAQDTWLSSEFRYNPSDWGFAMGSVHQKPHNSTEGWVDDNYWFDLNFWDEEERDTTSYKIFTSIEESTYDGLEFEGIVEKKWMTLGDYTDTSMVHKIYPLVRGTEGGTVGGVVDVYMSGTKTILESPSWKKIGRFDAAKMTKLSCRVSGNFIHVRFVIPEEYRSQIRGFTMEWDKIGRRA